jgi:prenylcysteine alpha-carboxyl methylesterase
MYILLTLHRKEAVDAQIAFFNAYRARSKPAGTLPFFNVLDKHNHLRWKRPSSIALDLSDLECLSNILSIGTEDEPQSKLILNFISTCVAKVESRGKHSVSASRFER